MQTYERFGKTQVNILPGEYVTATGPILLRTLLGSCVAACLYDPIAGVIGMNHFLLSSKRYSRQLPAYLSEAGRYGIHAMELLINEMLQRGARRKNLRAKAFGGGSFFQTQGVKDNFLCVGDVNVRFIREFLINEGIPLVASDLGGETARIIHFEYDDFAVHVKRIRQNVVERVLLDERRYWKQSIESQERRVPPPDIWK